MADEILFPLPKEHWLPHQGVKKCMSCSSTFPKTLFGTSKANCCKCGRVVCKQCLKYKIKNINNICKECYESNETTSINPPYLTTDSLKHFEQQMLSISIPDRKRSHSMGVLSSTSTVTIPYSLLDVTTDIPLPYNNVPRPNIIYPLLKKDVQHHQLKWLNDTIFDINEQQMKVFEEKTYSETQISNKEAMIIRLDAFEFDINITNNIKKPFDKQFHNALILTGCDILKQFDAYTIFVQRCEFIIIYPINHYKQKYNYLFDGKISKILSIVSSFASTRFMYYLKQELGIDNCFGSFNGKCFNIGVNVTNIFDYIIWRLRSNVKGYHKQVPIFDNEFAHGTFIKKEKNFKNERITSYCVQIESKNAKYYRLLTDKYWQKHLIKEMQTKENNILFEEDDIKDINIKIPPKPVPKLPPKPVLNTQFKIVAKRKSAPVYSVAKKFEKKDKKKEIVEIKNDIFDNNMYNRMVIPDFDKENKKILKFNIKNKKQKPFFKPKPETNINTVNDNNMNDKNSNNNNGSKPMTVRKRIMKRSSSHAIRPKSNFNIEITNDLQTIKPNSTRNRIKEMEQRLQRLQQ